MSFMNNINKTISDNMTFLKHYKANPESLQGTSSTSTNNKQLQELMPMLLMMMFQLFSQLSPQMGQYSASGSGTQDPFAGLPIGPPLQPNMNPNAKQNTGRRIQQNPAYQFLNAQLTHSSGNAPDFTNNASLTAHMNTLLASSPDPNLQKLADQLDVFSPDSPDLVALQTQAETSLKLQGRSDTDIAQFDLLFEGIQNNRSIQQFQAQHQLQAQNLEPDSPELQQLMQKQDQAVRQSAQNQNRFMQEWPAAQPTQTTHTQNLNSQVKDALAAHQFTPVQLGQSLKYLLDTAPNSSVSALSSLTSSLIKSGDLNIIPFLQSNYLDKLAPDRRAALLSSVDHAGLVLDNGKPNSRLAGFLLENLSKAEPSSTKLFLEHFLQHDWQARGSNLGTPEGKALANVLDLAGIQHTAGQLLNFS